MGTCLFLKHFIWFYLDFVECSQDLEEFHLHLHTVSSAVNYCFWFDTTAIKLMIEWRNQIFRCRRHVELFCIMCSMEASSSKVKQDKTNKPTNKNPQNKQNKINWNWIKWIWWVNWKLDKSYNKMCPIKHDPNWRTKSMFHLANGGISASIRVKGGHLKHQLNYKIGFSLWHIESVL